MLLDFLVDWDKFEGCIKVKLFEFGLSCAKILGVVHPVVLLILVSVQIRDGPHSLVTDGGLIGVLIRFGELGGEVMSLDIELET